MHYRKKSRLQAIKSKVIGFLLVFGAVGLFSSSTFALDLLEQSFQQSKQYDTVVDIGNNKNAVGNELIRGGTEVNL